MAESSKKPKGAELGFRVLEARSEPKPRPGGKRMIFLGLGMLFGLFGPSRAQEPPYPWGLQASGALMDQVIPPPTGFSRVTVVEGGFAAWLRQLPLLPQNAEVVLFDGRKKSNQKAHVAVVDMDVGRRDLQQCADAVMRLRAEYLRFSQREAEIAFHATSGDLLAWMRWRRGERPEVRGNRVLWRSSGRADGAYSSFRRYLNFVFAYAGSASLAAELEAVADPLKIRAGDVFIQGGFPGHAVLVVDVARDAAGQRRFLLAQSYMPAQQIHILRNPGHSGPWYAARAEGELITPEWRFRYADLRRFADP